MGPVVSGHRKERGLGPQIKALVVGELDAGKDGAEARRPVEATALEKTECRKRQAGSWVPGLHRCPVLEATADVYP